jgi:type II secretory pathway pseudopilin PulG
LSLLCHPETPCGAITCIEASAARTAFGKLSLRFKVIGDVGTIIVPELVRSNRRQDELWRTTCFEAFVKVAGDEAYTEFNFAPSTGWAGYSFSTYRTGMTAAVLDPPHLGVDILQQQLIVTVSVDVSQVVSLPQHQPWQIALSAVIEEKVRTKSYWALNHPPGKPDFHHPDCFALTLAPPERA